MKIQNPSPLLQFLPSNKSIYFKGKSYQLTDDQFDLVIQKTPDLWWGENDVVIFFTYYDDGSYYCERKRNVYDFKNKITTERVYEFIEPSRKDAKIWFDIFIEILEDIRLEQLKNSKEEVKAKVLEEGKVLLTSLLTYRTKALKDSDWTQLPDVPLSDYEKELWKKFRQTLRDITEDYNWYTNNFFLVDFPITPHEYIEFHDKEIEYLSIKDHWNNYGANIVKMKLARLMTYLADPQTDHGLGAGDDEWFPGEDMKKLKHTPYKDFVDKINKLLGRIDPDLKYEIVPVAGNCGETFVTDLSGTDSIPSDPESN